MIYDNEMKDRVEQIKKDLQEEKEAHAATLFEAAKLREALDEIGYKPLSLIKEQARQEAARECYEIARTVLVLAMKRDNFIGNAMDDLLDEINQRFGLEG